MLTVVTGMRSDWFKRQKHLNLAVRLALEHSYAWPYDYRPCCCRPPYFHPYCFYLSDDVGHCF